MTDEFSESEPTPALPLDYFEQHREPWLPVVQMVVWLVLVLQVYYIIDYAIAGAIYFTHATNPRFRNPPTNGIPLLLHIPYVISHFVMLIGAMDARKLMEPGRRWIVKGAMIQLIVALPIELGIGIYYHITSHHWFYGPAYSFFMFSGYAASGFGTLIFPWFLWKFFRRSEVREVFGFKSD